MQVGAMVGIVGGGLFLLAFIYKIYKVINRVENAIGVDDKGRTMSERMERVEYQLWENGGNSMKDQINTHGALAKQTATEVKFIKDVLLQLLSLPEMHQGPAPVEPKMTKAPRKKKASTA
jgi:hypothetical protein